MDSINPRAACFMILNTRLCIARKGSRVAKKKAKVIVIVTVIARYFSCLLSHFSKCSIPV